MKVADFITLCQQTCAEAYDESLVKSSQEKTESGVNRFYTFDPCIENLKETLTPQDKETTIDRTEIERWKIGLMNHWIIEQNEQAKYAYDLLCTLTGVIGQELKRFRSLEHPKWTTAISLLKGYMTVQSHIVNADEVNPQ